MVQIDFAIFAVLSISFDACSAICAWICSNDFVATDLSRFQNFLRFRGGGFKKDWICLDRALKELSKDTREAYESGLVWCLGFWAPFWRPKLPICCTDRQNLRNFNSCLVASMFDWIGRRRSWSFANLIFNGVLNASGVAVWMCTNRVFKKLLLPRDGRDAFLLGVLGVAAVCVLCCFW